MMTVGPIDPRSIANQMLDIGDTLGIQVTNLALQKLLYFAHGIHLMESKRPLVSGYFEAWPYGPVHPIAYKAFKGAAEKAINFRAEKIDIVTGQAAKIDLPEDQSVRLLVTRILVAYGHLSPGRLVHISHAKGAPWEYIVSKAEKSVAFGMRIPDNVIQERFMNHKVAADSAMPHGEPSEESPLA